MENHDTTHKEWRTLKVTQAGMRDIRFVCALTDEKHVELIERLVKAELSRLASPDLEAQLRQAHRRHSARNGLLHDEEPDATPATDV